MIIMYETTKNIFNLCVLGIWTLNMDIERGKEKILQQTNMEVKGNAVRKATFMNWGYSSILDWKEVEENFKKRNMALLHERCVSDAFECVLLGLG